MTPRNRHWMLLAALAALPLLPGCTPQEVRPEEPRSGAFGELYDGERRLAYGTEFPAASAAEAEIRGDRAWQQNDLDRALYLYVQSLELNPKGETALYKVGVIHRTRNNPLLAERAFRALLQLRPDHPGALEGVGLILLDRRDYPGATGMLEEALKRDPNRWQTHNALGILDDLGQRHELAIRHFQQALSLRPDSPQILNNLGYSQYLAGDRPGALESLRRAVALDPGFRQAWQNLGLLHTRAGRLDEAVAAFQHAGEPAAAYNNVGYLCMMDGRYAEAESYLLRAIDLSPTYYAVAHRNLEHLRNLRGTRFPAAGEAP